MPVQGYSVSYNPQGSPSAGQIQFIHHTIMKLNPINFVITHEHTDQVDEGKDHLQIFFTLDLPESTPACRITQKFRPHNKLPAFKCKKHKGSLSFGFGYCLKEVPATGTVLYTNLTNDQKSEFLSFYTSHKEDDGIVLTIPQQFFEWLKVYSQGFPFEHKVKGVFVLDFDRYWEEFISLNMDLIPSRADYYKCSLNFRGKMRGYQLSWV